MPEDEPVMLDPVDVLPETYDHPDEVTTTEAANGHGLWSDITDADDLSNGFPLPEEPPAEIQPFVAPVPTGRSQALARARRLREVLLQHGVPEVSIELVDGRPTFDTNIDSWNACTPVGVVSHHIASHPTPSNPCPGLWLVTVGRPDLPGPLCNGTAGVDLVYRIKTMGWANHAGEGGPWTLSGPCGAYTIPRDVGRPYLWGTEFEGGYDDKVWDTVYTNTRTGKAMTFREFMGRVNAGLVEGIWAINDRGRTPPEDADLSGYHGEHKTWAPSRKIDRLNYTTDTGRAEIRRYAKEDDLPTPEEVWQYQIPVFDGDPSTPNPSVAAQTVLAQAHNRAGDARELAAQAARRAERAMRIAQANRDAMRAMARAMPGDARAAVDVALAQSVSPDDDLDDDPDAATVPPAG